MAPGLVPDSIQHSGEDALALCSLASAGALAAGNTTGAGLLLSCRVLTPGAQPCVGPVAHAQCAQ